MTVIEYMIKDLPENSVDNQTVVKMLNQQGRDGWQCCAFDGRRFIFSRPVRVSPDSDPQLKRTRALAGK